MVKREDWPHVLIENPSEARNYHCASGDAFSGVDLRGVTTTRGPCKTEKVF
jgi:hypothetical protein